jgi:hypothetical protein
MTASMPHQMTEQMKRCIQDCQECYAICTQTAQHCLGLGGKHADPEHIRTLLDCADACSTSLSFMLRMSPHHWRYCASCAEICKVCAESCRSIPGSDEMMKHCADVCDRCQASCREMAADRR